MPLADLLTAPGAHDLAWWTTVVYLVVDTTVAAVVLSLAWRLARARLSLGLVGVGLLLVTVCDVFYVRAGMTGTLGRSAEKSSSFWDGGRWSRFSSPQATSVRPQSRSSPSSTWESASR